MKSRFYLVLIVVLTLCVQLYAQSESIEGLMTTGQEMLSRGAYSQAVTAFRQVVSRESDNFEAQFNLAFAYLGWGRHSNAVDEFKKAMRLQPKNSEIWSNIAVAYENMGKTEDAMGALYQAVQLRPDNVTARMNLAAMYANANHHAKAAAQFKQVLAYEDSNEDALFNLSRCLIALGQINDAKSYLKQTIAANPNNGEAHYELGNVYWKKDRDIDKGIAEYKLAIAVQPQSAHLYENLALAYEEKKMKTEAMDTWKTALSHTDDVLAKDKIKDRIDRLETGSTAPAAGAPKSSGGSSNTVTKEQINDLKNELRGTEKSQQRINTAPVNVMDDLNDMNEEDEKPLDLRDEAKKRANK